MSTQERINHAALWIIITILTLTFCVMCQKPSHAASGLYDQVTTPVAGEVITYRRTPRIEISNPLGGVPTLEFTSESVKLYPDGETIRAFLRRNPLSAADYPGKNIPLFSPVDGSILGYFQPETLYAMLLSTYILSEKKADGLVRLKESDPATLCYTTDASNPTCPQ